MNIKPKCYQCIFNQAYKLSTKSNLDPKTSALFLRESAKILSQFDLDVTPPIIAAEIYEKFSEITKIEDPYKEEKKHSIEEALKFKPLLEKNVKNLSDALKIAVMGNVIDFGVETEFNLEKEVKNIFSLQFAKNDFEQFEKRLQNSSTICYLADNAGENVFDEILIKELKKLNKKIFYIVRGKPIINDVTLPDLENLEIFELAEVIDSGVNTPGFELSRANQKAKDIFEKSDLVISKGMGNFECLFENTDREVFYLFKVKCEVVAEETDFPEGSYLFIRS